MLNELATRWKLSRGDWVHYLLAVGKLKSQCASLSFPGSMSEARIKAQSRRYHQLSPCAIAGQWWLPAQQLAELKLLLCSLCGRDPSLGKRSVLREW